MGRPQKHQAERKKAAGLYWQGFTVSEISRKTNLAFSTVDYWKKQDQWDNAPVSKRVNNNVDARLCQLIAKTDKSDKDFNEIEALTKILEKTARITKYENGGNEADLNPKLKNRQKGKNKKNKKAIFNTEQITELKQHIKDVLYPHQLAWLEHSKQHTMRQYLKSRQIGATYYFALEALMTALETGKNQIFMSASKPQAEIFKQNIVSFVQQKMDITLKGNPLKIADGTFMYFLGNNANTAQSYSGDLYVDEYFWILGFNKIQHVASGMAMHDDRRITYFSTPSATSHEAYPLWSGKHFNNGRPKSEHIKLNISHANLKNGKLCEDGYFRQVITIDDAIDSGFDLVTRERLKLLFPPAQYRNLLQCEFINDADSVFKLKDLQHCMISSTEKWKDFNASYNRPLGDNPVWIGYDPSRSCDNSSLVVVAPPSKDYKAFRVIERHSYNGLDFDGQAQQIKRMTNRYNVQKIAIDTTGIGQGVFELVQQFFRSVIAIRYSVEAKNQMVLKAQQVINHKLLEFDHQYVDIAQAFLTIHQSSTGRQITYKAKRTQNTGHADTAWAVMHALIQDPLGGVSEVGQGKRSRMLVF